MTVEEGERWLIGFYSVRESFPWNSSFLSAIYLVRPSILAVCYASQSSLMNLTLLIVSSAISFFLSLFSFFFPLRSETCTTFAAKNVRNRFLFFRTRAIFSICGDYIYIYIHIKRYVR